MDESGVKKMDHSTCNAGPQHAEADCPIREAARTLGARGGKVGRGASKVRTSSYAPGVGPWAGSRTRRYVVAPGVSADLCGHCMLAPVQQGDLTDAESAEWLRVATVRNALAVEPVLNAGRLHLSHARYQQIHPHPEGR